MHAVWLMTSTKKSLRVHNKDLERNTQKAAELKDAMKKRGIVISKIEGGNTIIELNQQQSCINFLYSIET